MLVLCFVNYFTEKKETANLIIVICLSVKNYVISHNKVWVQPTDDGSTMGLGEAKIHNLFYLHPVEAAAVNKMIF